MNLQTTRFVRPLSALLCFAAASLVAQETPSAPQGEPQDADAVISQERVEQTLAWLSDDERRGRDTGSEQLEQAAQWLAARFAKAGLSQLREGSWFHEFGLPAWKVDSDAVELVLTRTLGKDDVKVVLEGGRDVRQLTPTALTGDDEDVTLADADDPRVRRMRMASGARRPVLLTMSEEHSDWQKSEGEHVTFARLREAARPILLVREDALPPLPEGTVEVPSWRAQWKVARSVETEVTQRNVMALWPAAEDSAHKDEFVVVSAHYDHVGEGRAVDGDGIYNGADDNATGTTAVVLIAEALARAGKRLPRNVLFVCFAAEERGLRGSRAFCDEPPLPLDKVVANLNIEMIGRPMPGNERKAWITGVQFSDFGDVCAGALQQSGLELVEFPMAGQLFAASDNYSFVRHGVVAHSVSAGSLHDDYHKPGDELAKIDLPHMTAIVRGLRDVAVALASREAAPKWNDEGRRMLERARR